MCSALVPTRWVINGLKRPSALAFDPHRRQLYVYEDGAERILRISTSKFDLFLQRMGEVDRLARFPPGLLLICAAYVDAYGETSTLCTLGGIEGMTVHHESGHLFCTDVLGCILRINAQDGSIQVRAGRKGIQVNDDGSAIYTHRDGIGDAAQFNRPKSIAADSKGNLIIVDYRNQCIRASTPQGAISTWVRGNGLRSLLNKGQSVPRLACFRSVTVDDQDNICACDSNGTIRQLSRTGHMVNIPCPPQFSKAQYDILWDNMTKMWIRASHKDEVLVLERIPVTAGVVIPPKPLRIGIKSYGGMALDVLTPELFIADRVVGAIYRISFPS